MARAAIAAGADGLMVEVHPSPGEALSDGQQSLTPDNFRALVAEVRAIARTIGRTLPDESSQPVAEDAVPVAEDAVRK